MADDGGWLVSGLTEPEEIRRHYDDWAGHYDEDLAAWTYTAPSSIAQLVAGLAGTALADATVLDVGCGTGLVGGALREAGAGGRLIGVDLSAASLAVAERREFGGGRVYDEVSTADLQQPLAFADDTFDVAVCVGVLTYLPDTATVWRELARIVRAGGIVACTQRDDVWRERACGSVLHELERDGTWVVVHLSPAVDYLPGNADFGHEIGVRLLAARVRPAPRAPLGSARQVADDE